MVTTKPNAEMYRVMCTKLFVIRIRVGKTMGFNLKNGTLNFRAIRFEVYPFFYYLYGSDIKI